MLLSYCHVSQCSINYFNNPSTISAGSFTGWFNASVVSPAGYLMNVSLVYAHATTTSTSFCAFRADGVSYPGTSTFVMSLSDYDHVRL